MDQDIPLTANEKAIKMVAALITAGGYVFGILPIFLATGTIFLFYIPAHHVIVGGFAYYLYISSFYYISLINDDNDMDDPNG